MKSAEEIMEILNNFKGQSATFVNKKAFSAGAFISVATQKIFMAPQSVIGAAAPGGLAGAGFGAESSVGPPPIWPIATRTRLLAMP